MVKYCNRARTNWDRDLKIGGKRNFFFLFISNHISLCPHKNSKITKIRSTLLSGVHSAFNIKWKKSNIKFEKLCDTVIDEFNEELKKIFKNEGSFFG